MYNLDISGYIGFASISLIITLFLKLEHRCCICFAWRLGEYVCQVFTRVDKSSGDVFWFQRFSYERTFYLNMFGHLTNERIKRNLSLEHQVIAVLCMIFMLSVYHLVFCRKDLF